MSSITNRSLLFGQSHIAPTLPDWTNKERSSFFDARSWKSLTDVRGCGLRSRITLVMHVSFFHPLLGRGTAFLDGGDQQALLRIGHPELLGKGTG